MNKEGQENGLCRPDRRLCDKGAGRRFREECLASSTVPQEWPQWNVLWDVSDSADILI